MRNSGLDEARAGIKIAGRNINNLRYADDTTLTHAFPTVAALVGAVVTLVGVGQDVDAGTRLDGYPVDGAAVDVDESEVC